VSLGDGVKVYRALLAGNIEFGLTPGAPTIIGRSNGAEVKALSANLPKFEASMVVRADIKTMEDLKGKRIGIQEPGGFADILSRSVLRAATGAIQRESSSSADVRRICAFRRG
jgi:ABC-type nitrate/sulfonate/bicarbonate transport system substrate-binding protein